MEAAINNAPAIIFSLTRTKSDHFNIKHVLVCTRLLNSNVNFKEINLYQDNVVARAIVIQDTRENLMWVKEQLDRYGQSSLIFRDEKGFAQYYNMHELTCRPLGYLVKATEDYAKEQPFWIQYIKTGQYYSLVHD